MRPLGTKKTCTRVAGHQDCAVCHEDSKVGRAREKRVALAQIEEELPVAVTVRVTAQVLNHEGYDLLPSLVEESHIGYGVISVAQKMNGGEAALVALLSNEIRGAAEILAARFAAGGSRKGQRRRSPARRSQ